jgi:hypothetical protein
MPIKIGATAVVILSLIAPLLAPFFILGGGIFFIGYSIFA